MIRKVSKLQQERNKKKAEETKQLHELFREIWDEREDEMGYCYCFETGVPMHGSKYRSNTACYDHVLEKNEGAYPDYKMLKENIIILHPDVHTKKTTNIDNCPKVKKYRELLLKKHYSGELNGENNRNTEEDILEQK